MRAVSKSWPALPPDSLAFALLGAAHATAGVRAGSALPQALTEIFARSSADAQGRGAMQDIAYRAMRMRGRTDALIAMLAQRPPQPLLHGLLECALALLLEEHHAGYQAFTIVDQTVAAASAMPSTAPASGMVNAVLRRFLRETTQLSRRVAQDLEARWNYPDWWIEQARRSYPDCWESLLEAGNRAPPLTLRVNRRKSDADSYLGLLQSHDMAGRQIGPFAVRLDEPVPVQRIPGFAEGLVSVQDAAAQLAAPMLALQDGMRVLDACAAPGGKSGHLLEIADVELTAIDRDGARLRKVEDNLQRLGLKARLLQADATTRDWWNGAEYDCILADVPCTASGIVRRHPDIRWLRRPDDAARLAATASGILDNLWSMLRPGGRLLLVTCSVWPEESAAQAARFQALNQAIRLPAPGQLLPYTDGNEDRDGLFYALFEKASV